jgi:hypothetical protein
MRLKFHSVISLLLALPLSLHAQCEKSKLKSLYIKKEVIEDVIICKNKNDLSILGNCEKNHCIALRVLAKKLKLKNLMKGTNPMFVACEQLQGIPKIQNLNGKKASFCHFEDGSFIDNVSLFSKVKDN